VVGAVPVIVGVGEVVQRSEDGPGLDPLSLAAEAVRRAVEDSGAPRLLAEIDHLDLVEIVSWRYESGPDRLAAELGCPSARARSSAVGGHQPLALLDRMAERIAAGESAVAALAGGEALHSLELARRAGTVPPWPAPPAGSAPPRPEDHSSPAMVRLGLVWPSDVYPLYEQASRRAAGLSQAQARAEAAERWALASEVASRNPAAWMREPRSAAEIGSVSETNRMVSWPYPKLLNARLAVDQAAAVIVTSTAVARRLGIDEDLWVHPWPGAGGSEPEDVLARPSFERTAAGAAALDGALERAALDVGQVELIELYSCFPCVPRMAARHLGLGPGRPTTVTGGLTFFGGPGNNYMSHAVAAMTRALRRGEGESGLLYGQGGFVTEHHAMVLARRPPSRCRLDGEAASRPRVVPGRCPPYLADYEGPGLLETFSMPYGRDGRPQRIVFVGRTGSGARFAVESPPAEELVDVLVSPDDEPLGRPLRVVRRGDAPSVQWC
jgi:acetyl-CoA C-acetyltransferase